VGATEGLPPDSPLTNVSEIERAVFRTRSIRLDSDHSLRNASLMVLVGAGCPDDV